MSGLTLGYWDVRARAQPLRFLLAYMNAEYTEKTYYFDVNELEWFEQDKKKLKPFPNLPYIIEDGFYLSETDAVIKYIVKRDPKYLELLGTGKGKNDECVVDQLQSVLNDLRVTIRGLCASKDFEKIKKDTLTSTLKKFQELSELRGGNTFLLPYLTTADFKFQELLLVFKAIDSELYAAHLSSFDSLLSAFYSLPGIAEYVKTERYQKFNRFFPPSRSALTGEEFLQKFNQQFKQ